MTMNSALLVPIRPHALVVNDQVRKGQNFQRWQMNYRKLEEYASPMPAAFSGNTAQDWNNQPDANGIYLHWVLPKALRHGVQQTTPPSSGGAVARTDGPLHGQTVYPLVPNRWLVTRFSGPPTERIATAWVIESDFLDPNEGTTPYVDPFDTQSLKVTALGRKVDAAGWSEPGSDKLFLTATGAGDITFSAYQPYVENVFSIHDPLTDIDAGTVSYLVSGWYSDPAKDALAGVTDQPSFDARLTSLGWSVAGQAPGVCDTSLYSGAATAIKWDPDGPIPPSDRPDTAKLAVGNTSIDALTALIDEQSAGDPNIEPQLLEAFQYGLLPKLDQPNGPILLKHAIHRAWFGAGTGRFEWVILRDPDDPNSNPEDPDYPDTPIDWDNPILIPDWLGKLNQAQQAFDMAVAERASLQSDLYAMWWTAGLFANLPEQQQQDLTDQDPAFTEANFQAQLNPATDGSIANRLAAQVTRVQALAETVPQGTTAEDLKKAAAAYAADKGLPEGYRLNRYNGDPFFSANDPVALIAGAKSDDVLVDDDILVCRIDSQMVSGLTYNGTEVTAETMGGKIPTIDTAAMPIVPPAIFVDAFFQDSASATMIAAALGDTNPDIIAAIAKQIAEQDGLSGTPPSIARTPWQQPWVPLFVLWMIRFYPIAYEHEGKQNWSFNGEKYELVDDDLPENDPESFVLSGTTFLTPQASFNFKRRLEDFRNNHPNLDAAELKALDDFIITTDDWDFLSQTLDGFAEQLIRRDNEANVTPGATSAIGKDIGTMNSIVPIRGAVPQPFNGWPASRFQQYRSGQFCFEKLSVVDLFGQTIEVVKSQDYLQFKPVRAPDFIPKHTVLPEEPDRFLQVGPRILQPARLDFNFVSATDDHKIINQHSGTNPVCAWVLPNHIDRALSCYDPKGRYLVELRVVTNADDQQVVNWTFGPNAPYSDLPALRRALPHLGQMIDGLIAAGPVAFQEFFETIDQTLWAIDPLGSRGDQSLSVLVGRPLALTRSRLQLELLGPAVTDPSWQHTFDPAAALFEDYVFPVRLGEIALSDDGLIGYFAAKDYSQFNAVRLPGGGMEPLGSDYVKHIAPGNFIDLKFSDTSNAFVTMLVDPRASVHATTGLLPQNQVTVPAGFVEPAFQAMEITFFAGPLLSTATTVEAPAEVDDRYGNAAEPIQKTSVIMPKPSERNGTWSWLDIGDTGDGVAILDSDQSADFSNAQAELRTGLMRLKGALGK